MSHDNQDCKKGGLHVYSPEEIELFLSGDRREVDRLLITALNNIAGVLIPHAEREEKIFNAMGDPETIKSRAAWIDAQIDKQRLKNDMMRKVATSTLSWAAIIFIGWMLVAVYNAAVEAIKTAVAASTHP